ncbi:uncharacterized protein BDZ83DRAFT_612689 [Colletotrichum acutatum]|uniref:Uncharacterized protein n=1 Tax=Glomerella acutata TaxID=27357 RepID=A0AAD8XGS8_GLOAC|nr:uncharacterized protein BDZ83DRAFT_612689 [Colletotrichum acutatum]KAK1727409.1 hypothetical protein BDZ83DRAFT_612689 [Colletotrichum acutatum]
MIHVPIMVLLTSLPSLSPPTLRRLTYLSLFLLLLIVPCLLRHTSSAQGKQDSVGYITRCYATWSLYNAKSLIVRDYHCLYSCFRNQPFLTIKQE